MNVNPPRCPKSPGTSGSGFDFQLVLVTRVQPTFVMAGQACTVSSTTIRITRTMTRKAHAPHRFLKSQSPVEPMPRACLTCCHGPEGPVSGRRAGAGVTLIGPSLLVELNLHELLVDA